jgi:hypothetical protein
LRSTNAKEAGKTLQIMAQTMREELDSFFLKMLTKEGLFKVLNSGSKILAE